MSLGNESEAAILAGRRHRSDSAADSAFCEGSALHDPSSSVDPLVPTRGATELTPAIGVPKFRDGSAA